MAGMRAWDLALGQRVWLRGRQWRVIDRKQDKVVGTLWFLEPWESQGKGPVIELTKRDKVWLRQASPFENQRPPGAKKKGRHAHQWRLIAGGRGRLCGVCGRGDIKTPKGWRRAT